MLYNENFVREAQLIRLITSGKRERATPPDCNAFMRQPVKSSTLAMPVPLAPPPKHLTLPALYKAVSFIYHEQQVLQWVGWT